MYVVKSDIRYSQLARKWENLLFEQRHNPFSQVSSLLVALRARKRNTGCSIGNELKTKQIKCKSLLIHLI